MVRHLTLFAVIICSCACFASTPTSAGTDTPGTATPTAPPITDGLPNSLREQQHGVAPVYNDDLMTGTIPPNRWRGLRRPTNDDRAIAN